MLCSAEKPAPVKPNYTQNIVFQIPPSRFYTVCLNGNKHVKNYGMFRSHSDVWSHACCFKTPSFSVFFHLLSGWRVFTVRPSFSRFFWHTRHWLDCQQFEGSENNPVAVWPVQHIVAWLRGKRGISRMFVDGFDLGFLCWKQLVLVWVL